MKEKEINLAECREKINNIDEKMAYLFEERMRVVAEIAKYKIKHDLPTYDPERERQIILNNLQYVSPELQKYYSEFFEKQLTLSKEYQNNLRTKENNAEHAK